MAELPDLRASDADRERTVELLRHAAGEGRLDVDELDERADAAYGARTCAELERLTADLVPVRGDASAPAAARPSRLAVRPGEGGSRWLFAIMSGVDRAGHWRLAPRCTVVSVMGGAELDLNDVELSGDRTVITVFSLMGGAEIRVPDGLNVEVSSFGIMGGNSVKVGPRRPDPGGPVLALRLVAVMGGNDVRRGRKRSRGERRELRG
jgi:Domain of unknown function (DUF1707)/Cell wall-active antibiotics response 4TMS YvqF